MFDKFEKYLKEQSRSSLTIKGYLSDLRLFLRWFEERNDENFSPEVVTPTDLKEYRQYLSEEKKYLASTINRHLASLKVFLTWAVSKKIIESNPAEGIKSKKQSVATPHWLDKKEQFALRRAMEKDLQIALLRYPKRWAGRQRDFSMVTLTQNTGLRLAELVNVELGDIQLSERKGSVLVRHGKGDKQRRIPLNVDARKALQDWLEIRPEVRGNDFVFIALESEAKGALSHRTVQRLVRRYGQVAGLPDLSPHILRHTFAKNLVNSGVSLEKVAALLGHSSLETTRIYITPSAQDLAQAVSKIEYS
ncbi:MAG: tyrosine-type recombinase/integrase [Anaerolineae bacterium]|jgi:integrase/recombinase XerC|nr:tyrosine-type recombinase/integrase [Anaerolineae bacterium]MBT7774239.1 tyrosine-type recombinase/integrase [Anaerolineae bacterium]